MLRAGQFVLSLYLFLSLLAAPGAAQEPTKVPGPVAETVASFSEPWIRSYVGVTRREIAIPCLLTPADFEPTDPHQRVLIVAGLDGSMESVEAGKALLAAWQRRLDQDDEAASKLALSIVPVANPDAWLANVRSSPEKPANDPTRGYPPASGDCYGGDNPEAAYLWRWIGMQAPDLVVVLLKSGSANGEAEGIRWLLPQIRSGEQPSDASREALGTIDRLARELPEPLRSRQGLEELAPQLVRQDVTMVAPVPALSVRCGANAGAQVLDQLMTALAAQPVPPSPARKVLQQRAARSAVEVARQLATHYGQDLDSISYIPAMALVSRVHLSQLTDDPEALAAVTKICAPYYSGAAPALTKVSGPVLAGHLAFASLAKQTKDKRYTELVRRAAEQAFEADGKPKEAVPTHSEMSDAVFMGCPILAAAGRLVGDSKYFDMAYRHWKFMADLDLRSDGLYRHSPLCETAWGRGNGFPALGLSLTLSDLPPDSPHFEPLLRAHRAHLTALLKHQDASGMWHQVIDHPESYAELTSTSMITFAMVRGIRRGWLSEDEFGDSARRAWKALRLRFSPAGNLVDVCTGTGKQPSLRAYFDRNAILGRDARGGAMALLVSTEIAAWQRGPVAD